jgi:hypothetical protein
MANNKDLEKYSFKPGFDPRRNVNGAPRKLISTFTDIGYTKREINDTIVNMLSMTAEEIKQVGENEECTVLERTVAKALLKGMEKGSLFNIETTISRAMGTPNQSTDVQIDNKIEVVFVKGKTIL